MPNSILITQCLQRDFVDPILPHEPLPNRLHVGHAEALRLLGQDPATGPVAQLMYWARAQPPDALEIIHIRDWHDRNNPLEADHLRMFGEHCIRGTPGAELVLGLDADLKERLHERTVDSISLNDFEHTQLREYLGGICAKSSGPVRAGVVGVWTEAKVSYLLYDLKTRLGIEELGTCSALTASASRGQHFNALEQLSRILGVRVFDTVGEFEEWLKPGAPALLPQAAPKFGHNVVLNSKTEPAQTLSDADQDLIGYLYRDSSNVALEPLSGGFSGALVFRAASHDSLNHQQAPSVAKLGPNKLIGAERVAFERVEEILGNNAPSVRAFAELNGRAGIKYSYAAMGHGAIRTLKDAFEDGWPIEKINAVITCVFDEILAPFYQAARYERLPLLEHYSFHSALCANVRKSVEKIAGAAASNDFLYFPDPANASIEDKTRLKVTNLCRFYDTFLEQAGKTGNASCQNEFHFVSYVHGDLNGANILIDGRENVWIIDFFHTGPGHVLKDLAKLENDILYIFTPVADAKALAEALRITQALREVEDLRHPLPEKIAGVESPPFLRAWSAIRTLRAIGARICREDRDPMQMSLALLRFAAHTLSFDESSPLQKEWALASASAFAEDYAKAALGNQRLRIDWIPSPIIPAKPWRGRLGLTICPGRRDRGRDLEADLDMIVKEGVTHLVCLITESELEWAGVRQLAESVRQRNIQFHHMPTPDQGAPGTEDTQALVHTIAGALDLGENVVIHCMGGLGRSGTLAACVLMAHGVPASAAIAEVRRCRGPRAIESREQAQFVQSFA